MSEVRQIRIGGNKVGLLRLEEAFRQVQAAGLKDDDDVAERLVDLVSRRNYVIPGRRDEYAKALLREYRRFLGEDVPREEEGTLEIRVLGPGCLNCDRLMQEVLAVLAERGVEADLEHVRDLKEIAGYGPVATPALVINRKVVAGGRVPRREKIEEWIEEASR